MLNTAATVTAAPPRDCCLLLHRLSHPRTVTDVGVIFSFVFLPPHLSGHLQAYYPACLSYLPPISCRVSPRYTKLLLFQLLPPPLQVRLRGTSSACSASGGVSSGDSSSDQRSPAPLDPAFGQVHRAAGDADHRSRLRPRPGEGWPAVLGRRRGVTTDRRCHWPRMHDQKNLKVSNG